MRPLQYPKTALCGRRSARVGGQIGQNYPHHAILSLEEHQTRMISIRTPGRRPWRCFFALVVFIANINCDFAREDERAKLPPRLRKRICAPKDVPGPTADYQTPTRKLNREEYPFFEDDLDLQGLELVLRRQLERFRKRNLKGTITFGTDRYPLTQVRDTLLRFQELVDRAMDCRRDEDQKADCMSEFRDQVMRGFNVYAPLLTPEDPRYGQPEPTLFTGYYTAHLEVSLWPTQEYRVPIYAKPSDEWFSRTGRFEIDFQQALSNRGWELFYAKDRFSVYLLHLEGGGKVSYVDANGTKRSAYLSFAGTNNRQWRFISTQMLEKKWITNPAVYYQRRFINENPQLEPQIFSYCPSYVFFRKTTHPPEGSDLVPLTDNRSIATDRNFYGFKGILSFVRTKRPKPVGAESDEKNIEMMPFSRFVLDQDTGGAIRGKARVDFYFGEGEYAELAANTVKNRGDLFFLMLKSESDVP